MENPLTEAQIKRLNEIAILSAEEQKQELPRFLATLTPEQVAFLEGQQSEQACPFCLIASGHLQAKRVYEDDMLLGVLDIRPANKGHTILFPKKHASSFSEIDAEHFFRTMNVVARNLMKCTDASGVSFISGEGEGQKVQHIMGHIIPRFKNDNLDFGWSQKQVAEDEMNEIVRKMKEFEDVEVQVEDVKIEEIEYEPEERVP